MGKWDVLHTIICEVAYGSTRLHVYNWCFAVIIYFVDNLIEKGLLVLLRSIRSYVNGFLYLKGFSINDGYGTRPIITDEYSVDTLLGMKGGNTD